MEKLYTTNEVLEYAKVSRATLYRDIERNIIIPIKISNKDRGRNRYKESDVLRYAKEKELNKNWKIEDGYMTVEETCELLQIHRATLYRMTLEGVIKSSKKNGRVRYKKEDIEDYLHRQKR